MFERAFLKIIANQADKFLAEKIKQFECLEVGENENSFFGLEYTDLNGFKFLEFKLVCPIEFNTYKGCNVIFHTETEFLEIESDTKEIISTYSTNINLGISEFEIDLEEELINLILNEKINSIEIVYNKESILFNNINQEHIRKIISS